MQQSSKSSMKGTPTLATGGKGESLKPASKTPLSSSTAKKSASVSSSSGKPPATNNSSPPPRSSKPATTSSKVGKHPNHTTSSHKPSSTGTKRSKAITTSSSGRAKFWPFGNPTKPSADQPGPGALRQTLVTGDAPTPTTFRTVTAVTPKAKNDGLSGMVVEENWDKQVVGGKTNGDRAAKMVRSHDAPALMGLVEDDEDKLDFQNEDLVALGLDGVEFLGDNGWSFIKRDATAEDAIQVPRAHEWSVGITDDAHKHEEVENGRVPETKAQAMPFAPQPAGCTVRVPVVGGFLNAGRIAKAFSTTTTVTRTYDCGSCGATGTVVTFNAAGKGPVVRPATATVTAKDAFTDVVRVCATPTAIVS